MGVWDRSWAITRTSFGLIGNDKEMISGAFRQRAR